ncbi:Tda11p [Lachancea thermotolerans CBS 6340]|uniref:Topoisomerase I damage affected protein 11 n=1 Tax=Lachancea thermotolerans (strain ATCC 56472 / CBS 6340 / NRRL Y-8284) TaxID=559295 RepID=TDA11_LACTC|nr:KLTH0C01452p [Lachancea thermotolerans CBS 6340]C5DDJ3.1 RecName: Full=Topoisomerase I damage affected protein 11 [Lachancea thermotolerans CBS 6340]CAR21854.1 KLTH0C01452p [Lachancea thermotolerans CBS 6340]
MSKLDGFIEEHDRESNIDSGARLESTKPSPKVGSPAQRVRQNGVKSPILQTQATPAKPSEQEHPLKETPTRATAGGKMTRSNTLKRLSLIQPVISPETTPKEHRQQQATRNRSRSVVSVHSRSSSSASEQLADATKDVNALLQLLANKELELLETKHKIEELKKTLTQEEKALLRQTHELQDLKTQVGKALNSGIDEQIQQQSQSSHHSPNQRSLAVPTSHTPGNESRPAHAKKESVWTKPLSFLNQFDQLIQHELEKKLNWDDVASPEKTPGAESGTLSGRSASPASYNNGNSNNNNNNNSNRGRPNEDVLGNMSSSLWSFVSDVKTGLLGINEEEEEESAEAPAVASSGESNNQLRFVGSKNNSEVELKEYNASKRQ